MNNKYIKVLRYFTQERDKAFNTYSKQLELDKQDADLLVLLESLINNYNIIIKSIKTKLCGCKNNDIQNCLEFFDSDLGKAIKDLNIKVSDNVEDITEYHKIAFEILNEQV